MNGKRLSLAAVISLSMFTLWGLESCSKNNTTTYTTDGTLTATVNGTAFSANSFVVAGYLSAVPQYVIQGDSLHNNDTSYFQITLPYNFPVNQAISVDTTGAAYLGYLELTYVTQGKQYDAYYGYYFSHGTVNLNTEDTVNRRLDGSFSGVLYASSSDSVVVTNGAFNSVYQVQ